MENPPRKKQRPTYVIQGWRLWLVKLLAGVVRCYTATLRFREDADSAQTLAHLPRPAVVLLWHNRLLTAGALYRRYPRGILHALVSTSKDGAWLAAFMQAQGLIEPIRGSSSKGGRAALREMLAAVRQGHDVAITPDGPRGPCYSVKEGAAVLAKLTQTPILCVVVNARHKWCFPSWDRFQVPLPFSRVDIRVSMLSVDQIKLLSESREAFTAKIREMLLAQTQD